jgi:hypothetical protein
VGRVEHDDLGRRRRVGERPHQIEQANALQRDLALAIERRVDRDQIVVALGLDRVAIVVDERDRVGPRRVHLVEKLAEQPAHVVGVDVGAFDDLEADAGQRLGDEAAVGQRRLQRSLRIGGVADDERDALLRRGPRARDEQQRRARGEDGQALA